MHRATGEWREPGAVYGSRVDQVRVADDAGCQRGLRLRQQRPDQAIDESGWNRTRRTLRGFARTPVVEAALRLAAQVPRRDQFGKFLGGLRALAEHLADGEANVEADGVRQFDRTHRHTES